MKPQALQDLVKKIFGDEKSKTEFQKDPETYLNRYNLTKQERQAILKTNAKLGLAANSSGQLEAALKAENPWVSPIP